MLIRNRKTAVLRYRHCTPDGVHELPRFIGYKHSTPSGVQPSPPALLGCTTVPRDVSAVVFQGRIGGLHGDSPGPI